VRGTTIIALYKSTSFTFYTFTTSTTTNVHVTVLSSQQLRGTLQSLSPVDNLRQFASKSIHSFSKHVHKFGHRQTKKQMDRRMKGEVENIMLPANLIWQRCKHFSKIWL